MNILNIVEECYNKLPHPLKKTPWKYLNHGYDALDSDDKLNAYVAAYGEMHVVKCRKAMQNFPFDDLWIKDGRGNPSSHIYNFEIFDWGCGQGIGTLTFLEYLKERDMLHGLSVVNLIEPSPLALTRAKNWVSQSVNPFTEIKTFNRYIPGNGNPKWADIECHSKIAIHIFSNILDIRSVGLRWLAVTTSTIADKNYYICVGPRYGKGVSRIEDFHNLLNSPQCFADFSLYPCGYTKQTNYPYGIEVKTFYLDRTNGVDAFYQEQSTQDHIDEYQAGDECFEDLVTKEVKEAYHQLKLAVPNSLELYFKPAIGVERPDFVFANISNGIVLINVCTDIKEFDKEFEKIEAIKKSLFDIYVKSLKIRTIISPKTYNSIKVGLYFPSYISKEDIDKAKIQYYNRLKDRHTKVADSSNEPKDPTQFLVCLNSDNCMQTLSLIRATGFSFSFYQEIKDIIIGHWHSYSDGDLTFKLTKRQKELLKTISSRFRIKGEAGSGKTHLLAYMAVKEHLRTSKRVLILTYNIALIKYIRMRINQVPADFSTDVFDIINYHQFFWSKGKRYNPGFLTLQASDDPNFFESSKQDIIRNKDQYDTIIVDEAQDFMSEWFDILRKYFLTSTGRFILLGDGEQNIFNRELENEEKMPSVKGFIGSWNKINDKDREIKRQLNPRLVDLISKFAYHHAISDNPLVLSSELPLEENVMRYGAVNVDIEQFKLYTFIEGALRQFKFEHKDTAILAPSIEILRLMEYYFRINGASTITTFETLEEYNQLLEKHPNNSASLNLDLKAIRRVAKVHFTTDTPALKLATIQSFKGWEAKNIFLLVQKEVDDIRNCSIPGFVIQRHENMNALLYTGLSRARINLIILNVGNDQYHEFFKNNIKNE